MTVEVPRYISGIVSVVFGFVYGNGVMVPRFPSATALAVRLAVVERYVTVVHRRSELGM